MLVGPVWGKLRIVLGTPCSKSHSFYLLVRRGDSGGCGQSRFLLRLQLADARLGQVQHGIQFGTAERRPFGRALDFQQPSLAIHHHVEIHRRPAVLAVIEVQQRPAVDQAHGHGGHLLAQGNLQQ